MWMARRRFHEVTTDLAFHSWHMSRFPVDDAEVLRARLVDQVRVARARLGLPIEIQTPEPQLVARLTREIPLPATSSSGPDSTLG